MTTEERNELVLSCLDELAPVIARYARYAHLEYEDALQETAILILKIIEKPYVRSPVIPYLARAIRFHFIDEGKKYDRKEAHNLSLDMSEDNNEETCLADLLPSPVSINPLNIVLAKERLVGLYEYTMKAPAHRSRKLIADCWNTAVAAVTC